MVNDVIVNQASIKAGFEFSNTVHVNKIFLKVRKFTRLTGAIF